MNKVKDIAGKHLGNKEVYAYDKISPELLVGIPRELSRQEIGVNHEFSGIDMWTCYEFSTLRTNGLPVCGILKLSYPSTTPNIVESKSLKLYLNSWNNSLLSNELFLKNLDTGEMEFVQVIGKHLEEVVDGPVTVGFHKLDSMNHLLNDGLNSVPIKYCEYSQYCDTNDLECTFLLNEDKNILRTATLNEIKGKGLDIPFTNYQKVDEYNKIMDVFVFSTSLLRSNCRVTGQPDWGSLIVQFCVDSSNPQDIKLLDPISFLQYIISLRKVDKFHEECCEKIYCDIMDVLDPDKLLVSCFYTRRGGIDINPARTTCGDSEFFSLFSDAYNPKTLTRPFPRQ